jgi:hypothetical protein
VDRDGRVILVPDAHRGDGKRLVVRADEKLTAFLELESPIRVTTIKLAHWRDFFQTQRRCNPRINAAAKNKVRTI